MIRCSGRKVDSLRAISPDSVKTAVTLVPISSDANAAASQRARLTRPDCRPAHLVILSVAGALPDSAESIMRHMVSTDETGYRPLAGSLESINASVPSQ